MFIRPLSLAGLGLLAGCATLGQPRFESPTVDLQSIVVRHVDLTGAELDLVFSVDNPNVFDIHGAGLEAGLTLEDVEMGRAFRPGPFSLAGSDTTRLIVPMSLNWAGLGAAARGVLTKGEVNYQVDGAVQLETPFGEGRVPYRQSGVIPVLPEHGDGGR